MKIMNFFSENWEAILFILIGVLITSASVLSALAGIPQSFKIIPIFL
jgi:hypothetical protein